MPGTIDNTPATPFLAAGFDITRKYAKTFCPLEFFILNKGCIYCNCDFEDCVILSDINSLLLFDELFES